MTFYFAEGEFAIVSFETDPIKDPTAPCKWWIPDRPGPEWQEGGENVGYDVTWSGDYYPIPESAVPEMQDRCRAFCAGRKASGTP
jgi:hypothetical protein